MIDPCVMCERCGGDGYAPLFGRLFIYPCPACHGTGLRERAITRVWRILRHGPKAASEGDY